MAATTVTSGNPSIDTITTIIDDITGLLTQRIVNYTNGIVSVAEFDANGVIVSKTLTDTDNSAKWSTKSLVYEDGKRASETITFDDGAVKTTSYADGKRAFTTIIDYADERPYQLLEQAFDPETGKLLVTRTLTDSGVVRIQAGNQGIELVSSDLDETFHGGGGVDIFKFVPASGHDKIAKFTQGQDRLDLTSYGIFTAADLEGKVSVSGRVTTIQLTPDDSIQLIGRNSTAVGPLTDADLVSDGTVADPVVIASQDFAEVDENGVVSVDVLANDLVLDDPGGNAGLQIVGAAAPQGVTATPDDGLLIVDTGTAFDSLAEGETATFLVGYTAADAAGNTDDSVLTVTVTGVNDAPEANAIAASVDEEGPGTTLLADFTDVDLSDTHTFSVDAAETLGSVINNGDGTFGYDPNGAFSSLEAGQTATDTFSYTVDDGNGGTSTATATVIINGESDLSGIENGSFENALVGWSTIGSVEAVSSHILEAPFEVPDGEFPDGEFLDGELPEDGPGDFPEEVIVIGEVDATDGEFMARLSSGEGDDDGPGAGVSDEDIAAFLGVSLESLELADGDSELFNGSAMKTTVAGVEAGDQISFDWFFDASDYLPFDDSALALAIDGSIVELSDVSTVGDYGDSGWMTTTFTATESGDLDIGFAVMNVDDDVLASTLLVDNVELF